MLTAFLLGERRVAQPIIPLGLFASRNRAAAYPGMLMLPAAMFAGLYFLVQYAQDSLAYTPVEAGFAVVPLTLGVFSSRWTFPPLVKKFGPKNLLIAAAALIIIGLLWLSQMTPSTGYAFIVVPTIFCGVGVGIAFTALKFTALAGLPPQNAGAAALSAPDIRVPPRDGGSARYRDRPHRLAGGTPRITGVFRPGPAICRNSRAGITPRTL